MGILETTIEKADFLPVSAGWITPQEADAGKAILYFHGNGYEAENAESYRTAVIRFIDTVGYKTLMLPCSPASGISASPAIKESAEVYRMLLEQGYQPQGIVFAGDRAGGGIEFCTLIKLRDDGIPLPAACVAFSPNLKAASLLSGDLTGLPPIMIHVGYDEIRRNNVARFGALADSFGVDVRIKVWKDMSRSCPFLPPGSDGPAEAMNLTADFIRRHTRKESNVMDAFLYTTMFFMP